MKVLMFGLEFPPHISGGLGTACFGLTESLTRSDIQVLFVIPKTDKETTGERLKVISACKIDVPVCSILKHKIQHIQKSYDTLNKCKAATQKIGQASLLNTWGNHQTSDHFYYRTTITDNDGMMTGYFTPYASSCVAFMNYMIELTDLTLQIEKEAKDRNQNIQSFNFPHIDTLVSNDKKWNPEALTF